MEDIVWPIAILGALLYGLSRLRRRRRPPGESRPTVDGGPYGPTVTGSDPGGDSWGTP